MDVCILSMQRVQNFGSLLQSYALKGMLEELGCCVSFLDIEPNEADNRLLTEHICTYHDEGEVSGTVLEKLKKLDRYTVNRVRGKLRAGAQNIRFEQFRRSELGIKGRDRKNCDLCVIGSDEVFNCLCGAPWGFTSQLFGQVSQADRVITYAASCGSTSLELVPEQVAGRISDAFNNIAAFSVRDQNTAHFVSELAGLCPQEHLDPVAVADFSVEMAAAKGQNISESQYCVVYSYYNRISDPEEIRQIQAFCKERDLHVVAVGAPQKWISDYRILDPFEMLNVFANADFVITDTFHGTIFSAKYAKRFAILVRNSNRNKLEDLIERLSLQSHRITSMSQLEDVYDIPNQTDILDEYLRHERKRSMKYLQQYLCGEDE